MVPIRVTKRFETRRTALGFEQLRLHDVRHFNATSPISAGVNIRRVSGETQPR